MKNQNSPLSKTILSKTILCMLLAGSATSIGLWASQQSAIAAPHAFFRPVLSQLRQASRNCRVDVRLPSILPSGLTRPFNGGSGPRRPVPVVDVEDQCLVTVIIKIEGCEQDFPGGRGYSVECMPWRLSFQAASTPIESFLASMEPSGSVSLRSQVRAQLFIYPDYPYSRIRWVQGRTRYQLRNSYGTAQGLTNTARSIAAESPLR
jgi:hypothetical protein